MRHPLSVLTAAVAVAATLPLSAPARGADGAWRPTLPATSAFDNLSAFPNGTAYATVGVVSAGADRMLPDPAPKPDADSTGFFRSTDFGQTWVPVAPPRATFSGTTNLYVRFGTPTIGYATYSTRQGMPGTGTPAGKALCRSISATFRTTDGGQTWSPLCEPRYPNGEPYGFWMSPLAAGPDGRTVVLAGTGRAWKDPDGCEVNTGVVSFSTDSGETWRNTALPHYYEPGWMVRAYDNRTALVVAYHDTIRADCSSVGDANAVFLTTDAGRTYRKIYDCPKQPLCSAAAFVTRSRILVGTTDGTTAVTNDAGRHWIDGPRLSDAVNDAAAAKSGQQDQVWWHWVQAFDFADAKHGYASTRGAGTWRTDDGGDTWTQERSHECVYYPYGVGDNATLNADVSVTGGPGTFSTRSATPTPAGPCHPAPPNVPAGAVAVRMTNGFLRLDGVAVHR